LDQEVLNSLNGSLQPLLTLMLALMTLPAAAAAVGVVGHLTTQASLMHISMLSSTQTALKRKTITKMTPVQAAMQEQQQAPAQQQQLLVDEASRAAAGSDQQV
jgi:hypothetical protein